MSRAAWIGAAAGVCLAWSGPGAAQAPGPLDLERVLTSVEAAYPPLLAARIERDLADGRLRAARGVYDLEVFAKLKATPDGYYEYSTVEAGAEQFLGLWGAALYGGYRLTGGEDLPDYYPQRTQGDGEATVGLRLPLLKGGAIDEERAQVARAEIGARAADPVVERQRLDFVRAGTVAWARWVAAGRKLAVSRELLRLARDRAAALEEQVAGGLRADIVLVDNRRLVVDREIGVLDAGRAFRGAALALSLLYRGPDGTPVVPGEDQLPVDSLGPSSVPGAVDPEGAVEAALARRPELTLLALKAESAEVDAALARNGLLPQVHASVEAGRNFGEERYADRSATELRVGVEVKLPVQRREAGGKTLQAEAGLDRLYRELAFARETIAAEVRDAATALEAAVARMDRAALNVELALELQAAEQALFQAGSSDLLALQLREQAAFDARMKAVDAWLDAWSAWADWQAAVAAP